MGTSIPAQGRGFESRYLVLAGYVVLLIGALFPILDFISAVTPPRVSDLRWRFGAGGLISTYANATLIDLFLIALVAAWARHRRVLLAIGVVAAVGALLFAGIIGIFVLDGIQIRAQVTPDTLSRFDVGSLQALVKLLLVTTAAAVLSFCAIQAARREVRESERLRGSAPLVVGKSSAAPAGGATAARGA